jgi:hypothetical protein
MWNDIQHSQLQLGSWNWLDSRWGEKIWKRNTFLKATLVILFVSVNELCVYVPKEFSMWNNIQLSRSRLGSWNWLDFRWGNRIRKRNTCLKATLVILFVSVNELCVHVPKEFSICIIIQHSQLRLGSWNRLDVIWGGRIRKRNSFWKPPKAFHLYRLMDSVLTSQRNSRCGIVFSTRRSG